MAKKKQTKPQKRSKNSMTNEEIVREFDAREDRAKIVEWKQAYSEEYTDQSTGNNVGRVETIIGELAMFFSLFALGFRYLDRVPAMAGFAVGLVFFAIGAIRNKKEREKFNEADVRKTVNDKLGYTLTREQHDAFKRRQLAKQAMVQEKRDVLAERAQEKSFSNRIKKLFHKDVEVPLD